MRAGRLVALTLIAAAVSASASAGAAQRCDLAAYAPSSPDGAFVDHGDGTVTDRRSRLMWLRCSVGQRWVVGTGTGSGACVGVAQAVDWGAANAVAETVNARGEHFYDDWRLPGVHELATIAERQCSNPRINLTVFPDTPTAFYWTASPTLATGAADAMLGFSFGPEGMQGDEPAQRWHVRLVRRAD